MTVMPISQMRKLRQRAQVTGPNSWQLKLGCESRQYDSRASLSITALRSHPRRGPTSSRKPSLFPHPSQSPLFSLWAPTQPVLQVQPLTSAPQIPSVEDTGQSGHQETLPLCKHVPLPTPRSGACSIHLGSVCGLV